jgi:hypothetical protein
MEMFKERLRCYDLIDNKHQSCDEIFRNSLTKGPKYAKELKDLHDYSIRNAIAITSTINFNKEIIENYEGYSTIFPYDGVFPWTEVEDINDYLYSFIEPNIIQPEFLEEFRDEFLDLIRDFKIRKPDDIDLLYLPSNTMGSYEGAHVNQKLLNLIDKQDFFGGTRCIIPVGPNNFRDAAMPNSKTLKDLKKISFYLKQICRQLKESAHHRKFPNLEDWRSNDHYDYYHIDIRKCGLTFPHQIIEEIYKVLLIMGIDLKELLQFKHCKIYLEENQYCYPRRGYVLGWANELPTIAHCVISSLLKKRLGKKLSGVFFNDDSLYRYKKEESFNTSNIMLKIISTYNDYDFIIKMKSCFVSRRSTIFCETYSNFDADMSKLSKYALALSKVHFYEDTLRIMGINMLKSQFKDIPGSLVLDDYISERLINLRNKEFVLVPQNLGGLGPRVADRVDWIIQHVSAGSQKLINFLMYKYISTDNFIFKITKSLITHVVKKVNKRKILVDYQYSNDEDKIDLIKYKIYLEDFGSLLPDPEYSQYDHLLGENVDKMQTG